MVTQKQFTSCVTINKPEIFGGNFHTLHIVYYVKLKIQHGTNLVNNQVNQQV